METNKIICFKQDTKERKQWFKAASFAHPAKMHLSLQIYLIEHYTKPGDTILDPMAGSGTILIACALGRNMILVELEEKFVKMQQDNYEKIKSLGPMLGCQMGEAIILQGDARNLDGLLADNILFSPPYAESQCDTEGKQDVVKKYPELKGKGGGIITGSYLGQRGKNNIAALPYGEISAVISSPPYAESQIGDNRKKHHPTISGIKSNGKHRGGSLINKFENTQENPNNIGNLSYGDVDAILTSPPYEGINTTGKANSYLGSHGPHSQVQIRDYRESEENIGNLKSENYLQAMLQVYKQCHRILREKGLMVLVVKNFIRDKKVIRLDLDTIKICEKAGFKLKETLKRKLTQQSFWRIIALLKCDHRKSKDECKLEIKCPVIIEEQMLLSQKADEQEAYAEECKRKAEKRCPKYINTVPKIEYEDILVFQKQT